MLTNTYNINNCDNKSKEFDWNSIKYRLKKRRADWNKMKGVHLQRRRFSLQSLCTVQSPTNEETPAGLLGVGRSFRATKSGTISQEAIDEDGAYPRQVISVTVCINLHCFRNTLITIFYTGNVYNLWVFHYEQIIMFNYNC